MIKKLRRLAGLSNDPRCTIEEGIEEIKKGRMIIVTDSEDRENEGDLVMAAEDASPENINFMVSKAKGLICVPLTRPRANSLKLNPMVSHNEDVRRTAFTVSVDARSEVTTGISAHDRSRTVKLLANSDSRAEDFTRPGHIFPLVARDGGVLVRAGHTEAAVDLAQLAGKLPAGVICEIMNDDGTMARMSDLTSFARKENLKVITIEDLIEYRREREKVVYEISRETYESVEGKFQIIAYRTSVDKRVHFVITIGNINTSEPVPVRVYSENRVSSLRDRLMGNADEINLGLSAISKTGKGVLLLIGERENDLLARLNTNVEVLEEDRLRDTGIGAQILSALGLEKIILITDNPKPIVGLEAFGLEVAGIQALHTNSQSFTNL